MSLAIHCDSCETWGRGTMTEGFLKVNWDGLLLHFCSWDCILRYAADMTPMTVLDA